MNMYVHVHCGCRALVIFHATPGEVASRAAYRKWMGQLPGKQVAAALLYCALMHFKQS